MQHHARIDVCLELLSVCTAFFKGPSVPIARITLETGPLSQWLHGGEFVQKIATISRSDGVIRGIPASMLAILRTAALSFFCCCALFSGIAFAGDEPRACKAQHDLTRLAYALPHTAKRLGDRAPLTIVGRGRELARRLVSEPSGRRPATGFSFQRD